MLSKWPIRNKMLVGLGLLLVIVGTLSWSGINGVYAYRGLVKSLSRRASEMPAAMKLNQQITELRLSLLSQQHARAGLEDTGPFADAGRDSPLGAMELANAQFRIKLRAVRSTFDRYRDVLEANERTGLVYGDGRGEHRTALQIENVLDRIEFTMHDADWLLPASDIIAIAEDLATLQDLAAQLPGHLHQNLHDLTTEVRGKYRGWLLVNWTTTLSAALLLFVFFWLFHKWVFRPLRILVKGSRKIATGNYDYRIVLDTADEMAELAAATNDMTARFQAIRDDLDRQVRERTRQVIRNEKLASVGFLAAGVAHEINNPLASIAMCAESLEGRLGAIYEPSAGDGEQGGNEEAELARRYLKMIQSEAFRCKEITERLLDFSRMGDTRRQHTDLGELIDGVVDMVGHIAKYQSKRIDVNHREAIIVSVNPQEIKQVVLNLVTNALDSMGERNGTLLIDLGSHDDSAVMTFTDNGCGMTAEVLEHLFEPFFTQRESGQGTGLGLSIAYRIVADHRGNIEAASDGPGRGSTLRVVIPLANADKETHHRHQAA
ncbi:MAG: HAMP domain-containing sensor histidine kinase [Pirellulales bacterium]